MVLISPLSWLSPFFLSLSLSCGKQGPVILPKRAVPAALWLGGEESSLWPQLPCEAHWVMWLLGPDVDPVPCCILGQGADVLALRAGEANFLGLSLLWPCRTPPVPVTAASTLSLDQFQFQIVVHLHEKSHISDTSGQVLPGASKEDTSQNLFCKIKGGGGGSCTITSS